MWTCEYCGNLKNAENEDSCGYCEKRRYATPPGDPKLAKVDDHKKYSGDREPEVVMEKIFENNPMNQQQLKSIGTAKDSDSQSPQQPLSAENQFIQQLKSFEVDEEVCNALHALDLLDFAGLDYITQLEAKEIAEMLNVKIGKVIPAKFRDRVKIFIKSIQSTEDVPAREFSNDIAVDSASYDFVPRTDGEQPVPDLDKIESHKTPYWACKYCTVHNSIEIKTCSVCFSPRDDFSGSLKENKDHGSADKNSTSPDLQKRSSKPIPASVPNTPRQSQSSTISNYNQEQVVLKPIEFDKVNRHVYWLLTGSGNASQYTLGAVSACTTMAVQAAFSLLRNVRGKNMPFGITSDLLDGVLKAGAKYQNSNHQDILEVLKSSAELSRTLIHMKGSFAKNGMVDLDLSDPYPALTVGNDLKYKYGTNVCAIITCQAQSVCLFYEQQSDNMILFDSHARTYNGVNHGAAMLFFERMDALISYLKLIFPAVEQPDIRYQSEMEQLQYAHMMLAQADFLCLRAAITVLPNDNEDSSLYRPRQSWEGNSKAALQSPSHVQVITSPAPAPPAAAAHDMGVASQMAQVTNLYATMLAEQKATSEKLNEASIKVTRLETELKHEKEAVGELKKRLDQLERENKGLREENAKLKEKKPYQPPQYAARKQPNAPRPQRHGQPHGKPTPQPAAPIVGKMPANSYQEDELLARKLMEEEMRTNNDINFARALQEEEQQRLRDTFNNDLEIARRFEADAEFARLQADHAAAEDRRVREDAEIARQLADDGIFNCIICFDEVSIENVFDLDHDDHRICRECATTYVNNALKDKNVPINCPLHRCTHTLSETKCFEVLHEDLQRDWFDLSRRPHSDPGFRQCPVPDCKGFDLLDEVNAGDCYCFICQHHWCCNCQVDLEQSQHKDITCEKYQEWKRNNDTGDDQMEEFLRTGLNDPEGEFRMRRCPRCRVAFMKDKACMHVVCLPAGGGCGTHFCFRCGQFSANDATSIYNHQGTCSGFKAEA